MGITAAFDKVIFFNQSNRYSVLRMKTADVMIPQEARSPYQFSDHLIRFTAVGYDLPQTSAVTVELDGTWVSGKYGSQFQVERWKEIVPPTIKGVRAYLTSGLLKGIGEKTAEAIIDRFGIRTLDILEHQPDKLLEIRGITEEKLEEIKSGYAESRIQRELLTLLAPFKVTPGTAMKIYDHFGPGGAELLRESFYRLCEVPGFGFKRVDAIVLKSGGNPHDPMRIRGALWYALEKSRNEGGHLYMEAPQMLKVTLRLLNEDIPPQEERLTQTEAERELEAMIQLNVVVSKSGNIYLPHIYKQECETALKAVRMALSPVEPVDIASVMNWVRKHMGLTLSEKQAEGVEMVFRNNLSIITGGPGTGKSTILKAVVDAYHALYPSRSIALAAPTGKASRRMAETTGMSTAQTIHRLLELRRDFVFVKKKEPLYAGLLIVDESSMMDMWLAHQLFSRLSLNTKVLLVGDVDQLESVGAGNVFQELIESGLIPVTRLDKIFRQASGSRIAYNAQFVNAGNSDLYYGEDFTFVPATTQEEMSETICGLYKKEAIRIGVKRVQILSPYRTEGEASSQHLNEAIREEINPPAADKPEIEFGGKLFRLHDRVMQMKNNYDMFLYDGRGKQVSKGVFNGEVGTLCEIQGSGVRVDFDGRYAIYSPESLGELELSYATTIHKAMGSEYDTVIIPMASAHKILLTRNLFYTAITRAKNRVVLVGQKKALFMAISRTRKGKRNTLLAERMRAYHEVLTSQGPSGKGAPMRQAS